MEGRILEKLVVFGKKKDIYRQSLLIEDMVSPAAKLHKDQWTYDITIDT